MRGTQQSVDGALPDDWTYLGTLDHHPADEHGIREYAYRTPIGALVTGSGRRFEMREAVDKGLFHPAGESEVTA